MGIINETKTVTLTFTPLGNGNFQCGGNINGFKDQEEAEKYMLWWIWRNQKDRYQEKLDKRAEEYRKLSFWSKVREFFRFK